MKLVARAGKSPEPQPLEAVMFLQVREAHFNRDISALLMQFSTAATALQPQTTLRDRTEALLKNGERRYLEALKQKPEVERRKELDQDLGAGTWSVALVVDPPRPDALPDKQFLNSFAVANPNYTGWPAWLDSRDFNDRASVPSVVDKGWEALIISTVSKGCGFHAYGPEGRILPSSTVAG